MRSKRHSLTCLTTASRGKKLFFQHTYLQRASCFAAMQLVPLLACEWLGKWGLKASGRNECLQASREKNHPWVFLRRSGHGSQIAVSCVALGTHLQEDLGFCMVIWVQCPTLFGGRFGSPTKIDNPEQSRVPTTSNLSSLEDLVIK